MNGGVGQARVRHNAADQRYEVAAEGQLAVAEYRKVGDTITFTHTAVPEAMAGQGVASELARAALEEARVQGLTVIPLCPFIAGYIQRHPEYATLVQPDYRSRAERANAVLARRRASSGRERTRRREDTPS